ncbi:MAG: hypothetical protein EOO42_19965 [Flavobacteriales bacterium]|nr:MAG: hypothetical protein EOO42_19965 [Flavobacteriales bacterium]
MFRKVFSLALFMCVIQSSCFGIPGCQLGTGPLSRIYYSPTTQCFLCPSGEYWTNNGTSANYIVFTNAATECNTVQYQSPTTEYVKVGEISSRVPANSATCYVTNGAAFNSTPGTAVNFVRKYNCPIDDYIPYFILAFGFLGFVMIKIGNKKAAHAPF